MVKSRDFLLGFELQEKKKSRANFLNDTVTPSLQSQFAFYLTPRLKTQRTVRDLVSPGGCLVVSK